MKKVLFNSYSGSLLFCFLVILTGFLLKDPYLNTVLVMAGLNALSALGLSLLLGLAGQISLGQNGFYGLGAYLSSILALKYHLPVPLSILLSASLTALFSIFLALPALRLKGHYLAVATLAFGEIVYLLLNEWGPGGPSGFGDIPRLTLGFYTLESPFDYLLFVWTLLWILFFFSYNLTTSTYGRTFKALHSSETALRTLGINLLSLKSKIFMLSAFYTALSGGIYAHFVTFVSPANFSIFYSILILMMVMIGGMHSLWGALIGALFITLLPEVLRPFKEFDVLLYGLILTSGLLFLREGLVGTFKGWSKK